MKKFVILICVLVLALTACGGDTGATTVPTTEPTAAPTTQPVQNQNVDLEDLYNRCVAQMPEMILLDADMALNYCGISPSDCVRSYVAICADGLITDEVWFIEATDSEALNRLLNMVTARLEAKDEESVTYSPEQNRVVKDARTITSGNYLVLLVSPDADTLEALVRDTLGI